MEIRPSNHLTNLIGQIDYYSGYFNGSVRGIDEKHAAKAIAQGCSAISLLDDTLGSVDTPLEKLVQVHYPEAVHTERELVELWATLIGSESSKNTPRKQYLRGDSAKFSPPLSYESDTREVLFTSVSPFLIGQRLTELFQWFQQNNASRAVHPLLLIGTMHLCLLHIYPFSKASHAVALVTLWRNIIASGYDFCRYVHVASIFESDPQGYYLALRQSEKTAYGSWNSLNIWLEHLLSTLLVIKHEVGKEHQKRISLGRLTDVQRLLLNTVAKKGALTRDALASQTGINQNTVKYNLTVLTNRGYLTRLGQGRTTSYTVARS